MRQRRPPNTLRCVVRTRGNGAQWAVQWRRPPERLEDGRDLSYRAPQRMQVPPGGGNVPFRR
jgi:hypothetical protein